MTAKKKGAKDATKKSPHVSSDDQQTNTNPVRDDIELDEIEKESAVLGLITSGVHVADVCEHMEREYGEEYVQYKNRTAAIFPKFWKFKK